jgi:signal transduction histidine kinase
VNACKKAPVVKGDDRSLGGLGLGLSIMKHIVELHGGTVKANSDGEGCGATFIVHLPIQSTRNSDVPPGGE